MGFFSHGLMEWGSPASAAGPPDFVTDVAPIFQQHCLRCHQPEHKEGDLSLSSSADLLRHEYLVPGNPEQSYLLDVVTSSGNLPPAMPKEGTRLTATQIETLRAWIKSGAVWPANVVLQEKAKADRSWWSLQPLAQTAPPVLDPALTKLGDADWSRNPIDCFVLAKLLEKGLRPSPPADRRTWLRRVTYDLHGLPPTPEELAAFLADTSPDCYEKVVERLLASPRYAEQWGRHWLDVVRFGESRGYERNQIIDNLWPFRDYVIRSLDQDKPFDQFLREHLAGDVLAPHQP